MYAIILSTSDRGSSEWSIYSLRTGELICTLRDIISLAHIVKLNQRHAVKALAQQVRV